MITQIKAGSTAISSDVDSLNSRTEYATPWLYQLKIVTLRTFRSFWRQADYGFTYVTC